MKNLRTTVLCACIALSSLGSHAQNPSIPINEPDYNKPKLFAGLADRVEVNTEEINGLFSLQTGSTMTMRSTSDVAFRFDGEVMSVATRTPGSPETVIIRSTNFPGARMTLSRITLDDGSISYVGRILSFGHGDLYVLQKNQGQLAWVKKNFYDLVNE